MPYLKNIFIKLLITSVAMLTAISIYANNLVDIVNSVADNEDKYCDETDCFFPEKGFADNDIIINGLISWSNDKNLVLHTKENIILEKNGKIVNKGNGAVILKAGMTPGNNVNNKGTVIFKDEVPQIELAGKSKVKIYYNPNKGNKKHKYHNGKHFTFSQYIKTKDKKNALDVLTTYMLVNNIYDLQDINLFLSGNYALSDNIEAAVTEEWGNGDGFKQLHSIAKNMPFSGNFDGNGFTIKDLYINCPDKDKVGLFGKCKGFKETHNLIENLVLENFNITGNHYVGSLAGVAVYCDFANIKVINSKVNSRDVAGGVVGTALRTNINNITLENIDLDSNIKVDEETFLKSYLDYLADSDLVILSDYGKGTLTSSKKLIELASKMGKPVLIDPKSKDFSVYHGATIITPNFAEFEAVVGACSSDVEIESKARKLIAEHDIQALLVTRGASGMSLIDRDRPFVHLPTQAREVYDVTGAGDTVVATLGVTLAVDKDLTNAVALANVAAGEAVKKLGTATVSISELRRAIQRKQNSQAIIVDESQLLQQVEDAKLHGEKIVMTNGCFDILHAGHVSYLEKAKELGDKLIVAVNNDDSVKCLKGEKRPINKLSDRMKVLAALDVVDSVVAFSEDTPKRLIELISPDILVKGGDYRVEDIAGSKHVLGSGGEVIIIPVLEGFSTSILLEKIIKNTDSV